MIWESVFWKEELARISKSLVLRQYQVRWTSRSFALAEKEIMIGAFCIRKLLDSKKLSDDFENINFERERGLFIFPISEITNLITKAKNDHIGSVTAHFDDKLNDYVLTKRASTDTSSLTVALRNGPVAEIAKRTSTEAHAE